MTQSSIEALKILRKTDTLHWYIVPLIVLVIYIYLNEIKSRNMSAVYLGIYAFFVELITEIINALILHFTQVAPLWTISGKTAYLFYVGYNVEIAVFFAVSGVLYVRSLPEDKTKKILGLPNRIVITCIWGISCVFVEVLLWLGGILVWEYPWWMLLILPAYIIPRLGLASMHDHFTLTTQKVMALSAGVFAIFLHFLFAIVLRWI